jgi:hypothetical protein
MSRALIAATLLLAAPAFAEDTPPGFEALLAQPVALKPELGGVHPRVFVTKQGLEALRVRARTTHKAEWQRALVGLAVTRSAPPPPPGPQARRSQNNVAFAIAGASLAYQVEQKPEYLAAAKQWALAAAEYEPWGYTTNKPNVDLAAGHLLYAIGWAYDLLYDELTTDERARLKASLERHAGLVYDYFAPGPGKKFDFTQNHNFIPTAGLAVAALALMGESADAPKWAALARAHPHRAGQLLSPDGYYYEGIEYWIFSAPWLVHFLTAWEHATGESLWERALFRNWKHYLAHSLLPDGQNVFDFGDIWEGALTRAKGGAEYGRVYPGGTLQSNFNALYRVAARLRDSEAQAVALRYAGFGHGNLEEYWTLLYRDPELKPAPMSALPLRHHFEDSGVVFVRTSWEKNATAFAFKAGPPEGHRVAALLPRVPEWRLSSGHAHPDAGSFILWSKGRYLTGDTGYAGLPAARNHNTLTFGGVGQGVENNHDVWRGMSYAALDQVRIREADVKGRGAKIVADFAGAYPEKAGLKSLTRTFTWDGAATFTVIDDVALAAAKPVEWHLQSDTEFERDAHHHQNDGGLEVRFVSAGIAAIEAARATVKSPGPPGAIETGPEEERGYRLTARTPAAASHRIEVALRVR